MGVCATNFPPGVHRRFDVFRTYSGNIPVVFRTYSGRIRTYSGRVPDVFRTYSKLEGYIEGYINSLSNSTLCPFNVVPPPALPPLGVCATTLPGGELRERYENATRTLPASVPASVPTSLPLPAGVCATALPPEDLCHPRGVN